MRVGTFVVGAAVLAGLLLSGGPASADPWPVVPPLGEPYAAGEDVAGGDACGLLDPSLLCSTVIASTLGYTIETGVVRFRLQEGTAVGQGVNLQSVLEVREFEGAELLTVVVEVVPVCVQIRDGGGGDIGDVRVAGSPAIVAYPELGPGEVDDSQFFLIEVEDDCDLLFERRDVLTGLSYSPDPASFDPSATAGWWDAANAYTVDLGYPANVFCVSDNACVQLDVLEAPDYGEAGSVQVLVTWRGNYATGGNGSYSTNTRALTAFGTGVTVNSGTTLLFTSGSWSDLPPEYGRQRLIHMTVHTSLSCMRASSDTTTGCTEVLALTNPTTIKSKGPAWFARGYTDGVGWADAPTVHASLTVYDALDAIVWQGPVLGSTVSGLAGWCGSLEACVARCDGFSFPVDAIPLAKCWLFPQVDWGDWLSAVATEFVNTDAMRALFLFFDAILAVPLALQGIGIECGTVTVMDPIPEIGLEAINVDTCALVDANPDVAIWTYTILTGLMSVAYVAVLLSLLLSAIGLRVPLLDALTRSDSNGDPI